MPPQQRIFTDDLVVKEGRIGLVERAPNSSDDEDDDDIISDEAAHPERLPPGSAKVHWAAADEPKTEFIDDLRLADRVFLLGDIVSRSDAQLGQTGIVVGMRMYCDVRTRDGVVLHRVPTELLQPLAACRPGALVLHAHSRWLGRVDEVYDNVQLAFDDGAICKVLRTSANSLSVHSATMDEQTWFWPSMRVGASKETLRRAKWLKGDFRAAYASKHATVMRVQAAQALVRWLTACPSEGSEAAATIEPPAEMQRPSRLLELHDHHARRCWRLGEHAAIKPEDLHRLRVEHTMASDISDGGHRSQAVEGVRCSIDSGTTNSAATSVRRPKRKMSAVDSCVEVISCHTRVDVIWQDGSQENDLAGTMFAPAKHVDGYNEFWPQDFIVRKSAAEGEAPPVGVVLSVDHEQRIAVVSWRLSEEERKRATEYADATVGAEHSMIEERREVVPVYDIAPHPDFSFKVGDVVLKLPSGNDASGDDVDLEGHFEKGGGLRQDKGADSEDAASQGSNGRALSARELGARDAATISNAADIARQRMGELVSTLAEASPTTASDTVLGLRAFSQSTAEAGRRDRVMDISRRAAEAVLSATVDDDDTEKLPEDGGLSILRWVGQVKEVGPSVLVRWMDGSESRCAAETLYMVNTEEDDVMDEDAGSFDEDDGDGTGHRRGANDGGSSGWETMDSEEGDVVATAAAMLEDVVARGAMTGQLSRRSSQEDALETANNGPPTRRNSSSSLRGWGRTSGDEMHELMGVSSDEDMEIDRRARAARAVSEGIRLASTYAARINQPHPLATMGAASSPGESASRRIAAPTCSDDTIEDTPRGSSEDEEDYATAEEIDEETAPATDEETRQLDHTDYPSTVPLYASLAHPQAPGASSAPPSRTVHPFTPEMTITSAENSISSGGCVEIAPGPHVNSANVEEDEYSFQALEAAGFSQFRVIDEDEGICVNLFHTYALQSPFATPIVAGPAQAAAASASAMNVQGHAAAPEANCAAGAPPACPGARTDGGTSFVGKQPVYPPGFSKIAQKQWKLLAGGLPRGIYVVAFASRTDLLRALIIGPPGTPYQDAVFVFDLQLPPEFPMQPPAVNYLSYGERINPNLYENGKVCLSLLGTWTGRQSCELWNPQSSTVLQVLISIQALVLCEQPYYNEAGYERQLGTSDGAHHARRYNEGALLLSLKSMNTTLAHSAVPFDSLIAMHFSTASRRILSRCASLLELKKPLEQGAPAMPATSGQTESTSKHVGERQDLDAAPAHDIATLNPVVPSGMCTSGTTATSVPTECHRDTDSVTTSSDEIDSPVARAGLKGVLNEQPTLGFLYSLDRMVSLLERSLTTARSRAADPK